MTTDPVLQDLDRHLHAQEQDDKRDRLIEAIQEEIDGLLDGGDGSADDDVLDLAKQSISYAHENFDNEHWSAAGLITAIANGRSTCEEVATIRAALQALAYERAVINAENYLTQHTE
jgi:hypothetical protein